MLKEYKKAEPLKKVRQSEKKINPQLKGLSKKEILTMFNSPKIDIRSMSRQDILNMFMPSQTLKGQQMKIEHNTIKLTQKYNR